MPPPQYPAKPQEGEPVRLLDGLRSNSWAVAVHNDYWQNGERRTFWLFTHRNGRWIKGEGETDYAALTECIKQAAVLNG